MMEPKASGRNHTSSNHNLETITNFILHAKRVSNANSLPHSPKKTVAGNKLLFVESFLKLFCWKRKTCMEKIHRKI